MAFKHDGKPWTIREQVIEDQTTELTFQFEVVEGTSAKYRLRLFGKNLPFGNREIIFDEAGAYAGGGTFTASVCKPAWLGPIDA